MTRNPRLRRLWNAAYYAKHREEIAAYRRHKRLGGSNPLLGKPLCGEIGKGKQPPQPLK